MPGIATIVATRIMSRILERPQPIYSLHASQSYKTREPGTLGTCGHVTSGPSMASQARSLSSSFKFGESERLPEHAGYTCLGCKNTWSTLFALGQHRGAPIHRGTPCGDPLSSAELRNIPSAHLPTGLVRTNRLYKPGAPPGPECLQYFILQHNADSRTRPPLALQCCA